MAGGGNDDAPPSRRDGVLPPHGVAANDSARDNDNDNDRAEDAVRTAAL